MNEACPRARSPRAGRAVPPPYRAAAPHGGADARGVTPPACRGLFGARRLRARIFRAAASAAAALAAAALCACGDATPVETLRDEYYSAVQDLNDTTFTEVTASEAVKQMGQGWNLGNTMEADGSGVSAETAWGMPVTTERMIRGVAACGFRSVRIPVGWSNAISSASVEDGTYKIASSYLKRVAEIASWVINSGMYAVINIHWDKGWWSGFADESEAVRDAAMDRYRKMWAQIAEFYRDFPQTLIFESANEELGGFSCSGGSLTEDERYEKTNEVNQAFVDLVRKSGGNNGRRVLLIAGYSTDITMTCDGPFQMPDDTVSDRLMISVHYYTPWDWCGETEYPGYGTNLTYWGSDDDKAVMRALFEKMTAFTEAGYPVIVGEYGVVLMDGKPKDGTDTWFGQIVSLSKELGFCSMLWDCNDWYDRQNAAFKYSWLSGIYGN